MKAVFIKSLPQEAEQLSEIALLAKGHWDYPAEKLELWRDVLSTSAEYISANTVRSIWLEGKIVGFFSIKEGAPALLDNLWLHPDVIGRGIGRQAINEAKRLALSLMIDELVIISDPNAEGFYLHLGAKRIGEHPSTPPGRILPKLKLVTRSPKTKPPV